MNKLIFAVVTALAVGAAFAALPLKKSSLTPEECAARKAAAMRRRYERTGGIVVQPRKDMRTIAFVNVDGAGEEAVLNDVAEMIRKAFLLPVVVCPVKPADAGVVIEIKSSDYPVTIMTAPENGYAALNVARLKTDNPNAEKYRTRLTREVWRTFVYAMGGGNDEQPMCPMKPIATLAELDALGSTCPCPMSSSAIISGAERFGVKCERKVTYMRACEEGWAPTPTNDIQKAIWDKVHAMPTAPLAIKPETKKVEK